MSKVVDLDKYVPANLKVSRTVQNNWVRVNLDARNLNKGLNQLAEDIQLDAQNTDVLKQVADTLIQIAQPLIPFRGLYALASTKGYGSKNQQISAKKKAVARHSSQLKEGREQLKKSRLSAVDEKFAAVQKRNPKHVNNTKMSKLGSYYLRQRAKAQQVTASQVKSFIKSTTDDFTSKPTVQVSDIYKSYNKQTKSYQDITRSTEYSSRQEYWDSPAELRSLKNNEYIQESRTTAVNYKHKVTTSGRYKKGELAGNKSHTLSSKLPQSRTYNTRYMQRPPYLNDVDNTHQVFGSGNEVHIRIHNAKAYSKKFKDPGGEEYALAQYYHNNGSGKAVWNRVEGTSYWLEAAIGLHAPTDNYVVEGAQDNMSEIVSVYQQAIFDKNAMNHLQAAGVKIIRSSILKG